MNPLIFLPWLVFALGMSVLIRLGYSRKSQTRNAQTAEQSESRVHGAESRISTEAPTLKNPTSTPRPEVVTFIQTAEPHTETAEQILRRLSHPSVFSLGFEEASKGRLRRYPLTQRYPTHVNSLVRRDPTSVNPQRISIDDEPYEIQFWMVFRTSPEATLKPLVKRLGSSTSDVARELRKR